MAAGYLTGVALAPSSAAEESRFAKAQSIVATLLAGAFGTKLLSLWDTLSKGDPQPLIFQPAYYLPLLAGLVGYAVALAAFYTLRSGLEGQVRLATTDPFSTWNDDNQKPHNSGLTAGKKVQFAAAADFYDDLSVLWELKPKFQDGNPPSLPEGTLTATGLLTAPPKEWLTANPNARD